MINVQKLSCLFVISLLSFSTITFAQINNFELRKITESDTSRNLFGSYIFTVNFEVNDSDKCTIDIYRMEKDSAFFLISWTLCNLDKGKYELEWKNIFEHQKGVYIYGIKINDLLKEKHVITVN